MAAMRSVTNRQREILTAIVESYIATGEPVSSGSVSRLALGGATGTGMSSATVRNEMAELADAGLLEQPHTSAGRVPSAEAFRMYVAALSGGTAARLPGPSRAEVQSQIDEGLAGVAGSQALLARTSHVLATLSSGVGLAVGAATIADLLEHVHFSRLAEKRVLAVLVTRGGTVRDRVLGLGHDLSSSELETAANFLNEHFRGWALERVRMELERRLESDRNEVQRLQAAQALWAGTVPEQGYAEPAVFVDGMANIVGFSEGDSPADRARLREMLTALQAKQRVVELLNAYIDARQESVRVVFDLEEQAPEMAGLVLIAAPARVVQECGAAAGASAGAIGMVGVIGPKRMHYESAMNAVRYIAQAVERISGNGNGFEGLPR